METERKLAEYALDTRFEDLPLEPVNVIKKVVLTIVGSTIAGAAQEGCEALIDQIREWGGNKEATLLIHGGQVPAYNAAFANSTMSRALDICDGMSPGIHLGSSTVPTALAMAELTGGCTGKEFLASVVVGSEVAARINFSSLYDGFDPTGVCSIFATTAIAGRMLRLNAWQMLNALALAFNKSGGSFQSNIDGSLAVRLIQGFVSQGGILCAQLAKRGITGPKNFLEGIYGYFHLYAKDKYDPKAVTRELGKRFDSTKILLKKYPSCAGTAASVDAILDLVEKEGIVPEEVAKIDIRVTPYIHKLVGHPFEIGDNPRVNAQFNIRYCVASALLRKGLKLQHFEESFIREPEIRDLTDKIDITVDSSLEKRGGHDCAMQMSVRTREGVVRHKSVDVPRGFPENPLTNEEHLKRFEDCVSYGRKPLPRQNVEKILSLISRLEEVEDVRSLIPLMLSLDSA